MTLSYIPSDTNNEGILKATASGILPSGQAVVVNADGTVSVVAAVAQAVGSEAVFESARADQISSTFDSNSNKVVIAYKDVGNSNYGTCVVGTVSGTSISFGTPVVFESANCTATSATFDSNSNKVVIAYTDGGNSSYGTAIVGTVSGTSISFGTPAVFESAGISYPKATFESNSNKVVIAYRDNGNSSFGTAIVGTVSSTSISFGAAAVFESSNSVYISSTFDSLNNKVVISYNDYSNSQNGTAVVGTVSGTSISFGTPVVFEGATTTYTAATFDSNSNKVVIAYTDGGNSSHGTAIVGTVSGTSISFGTPVVFEGASTLWSSIAFDSSAGKVVIAYRDTANSGKGTLVSGTVSGTGISFQSPAVFESGSVQWIATAFDSNANKVVISYRDDGNSNYGTSVVFQNESTTLTAENYIGISSGVVDVNSVTQVVGSAAVFESAVSDVISATFDSNLNKVVISYQDEGNSGYGTSVIGTVSGTSISFGTPVVFESANTDYISSTFDSNSNKVVIAYRDLGDGARGKGIVGTVSGTTISFGTAADFNSTELEETSITFDSNSNKVVISWNDKVNNGEAGTSIVGTVSGTNISFGSAVVFAAPVTRDIVSTFDSNSNKVVIAYRDVGNSQYGTAIIGTVSGTSISFGTEVVFATAITYLYSPAAMVFDTSNNKIVIAYNDGGNTNYGTAIVGTVSGTSISFGTAVVFEASNLGALSPMAVAYDSSASRVVITYKDTGNSGYGTLIAGLVSGTSISFESPVVFEAASTDDISSAYDSNSNKVVIAYKDVGNSNYGTSVVTTTGFTDIIRGQVPSGTQAITNIIGSVSSTQLGLTAGQAYYVQTDGTIALTADDPSVFAGTAISATKLLVKT